MQFELKEFIPPGLANQEKILQSLQRELDKVAVQVRRKDNTLQIKGIKASLGSINRVDYTRLEVLETEEGFLLQARVNYRPSAVFWILLGLLLLTYIMWLIPLIFYFTQRQTVQISIQEVLERVRQDFTDKPANWPWP